jgi:hypothetical protein
MRVALLSACALWLAATSACRGNCHYAVPEAAAADQTTTGTTTTTTTSDPTTGDPGRAIAEADIFQLNAGQLYAMSRSGTLSVVDVSTPGQLALLGQVTMPGQPFEMYREGDNLLAMSNGALNADGGEVALVQSDAGVSSASDPNSGAAVIVFDVHAPAAMKRVALLDIPGEIADSRVVGNVLYVASYENAQCFGCGSAPRTLVTSFDISNPAQIKQIDQVSFQSNAPDGYNLPWGTNWKRSIFVNSQRLYIGGHADIDPSQLGTPGMKEGIIDVLDVTDPSGRLVLGQRLTVAGAILSRWQLDETNGVLRVISQLGAGRTGNGLANPEVATFQVNSTQSFTALATTTIQLPRQEGLRTVRFDNDRAYAITYNQTDPLFVIDLHDPKAPVQGGQLSMPGFMFYLEPNGDRVIGLGIDRTDPDGSLNVSLFDVSDVTAPKMLQRASFATAGITEDYEILNSEVTEDQDRIQKAFRVLANGLVVVPFSALRGPNETSDFCANQGGGVQLVQWTADTLTKRALLPLPGNPRRALENGGELLTISDSNVRTFSLTDTSVADQTADLTIGMCVPPPSPYSYGGFGGRGFVGGGDYVQNNNWCW